MKILNSHIKNLLTSLLLMVGVFTGMQHAQAQQYPVQGFLSIIPPYPAQLSDYANPNINRLNLTLTLNDISVNNKRVRLKVFVLRQNSLFTQTSGNYFGDVPITLTSGIPEQLTSSELAGYFKFQNLQGIVPDSYAQPLGEGFMNIYFVVYDYFTGRQLSNKIEFPFFILLNDPPLLNLPLNGTHISNAGAANPQIAFSWTSRATQASNTDYIFTLSPIYDPTGDPFTQFLAAIPVYQTTISNQTNLLYGFAEPPLLPGKTYGWRIQAKAKAGFEDVGLYKQNGYSEIHTFTYDSPCITIADQDVTVEPRASDRLYASWVAPTDAGQQLTGGYMVAYRKYSAGGMWNWQEQTTQTPNYYITGLEPTTDYEVKVARICTDGTYTYTNPQKATTLAVNQLPIKIDCGKIPSIDISNQNPLLQLNSGDVVMAGDFPVTILRANTVAGRFSGEGWVKVPYLADTKIHVTYQNIKVNTDHKLIDGYFETSYKANGRNIASVDTLLADVKETFDRLIKAIQNYDGSVKAKADATEADSTLKVNNTIIQNSPFLTDAEKQAVQESITKAQPCLDALKKGDTCPDSTSGTPTKHGPSAEIIINASQYECWKPAAIAALGNTQSPLLKNNAWVAAANDAITHGLFMMNKDGPTNINEPYYGISPDGKIIGRINAKKPIGLLGTDSLYAVLGFDVEEGDKVVRYNWDPKQNGYYNGTKLLPITRPDIGTEAKVAVDYLINKCLYFEQNIVWKYDPKITSQQQLEVAVKLKVDDNKWEALPLKKQDPGCANSFADVGKDDKGCKIPDNIVASLKKLLDVLKDQPLDGKPLDTDHDELVEIINNTCQSAISTLKYKQIEKLFVTLATDDKIKEAKEVAILVLIGGIKSENYEAFLTLLDADNSYILLHLDKEMDDAALPWGGNNYTNFMRALVTMYSTSSNFYLSRRKFIENDFLLTSVVNLNPQPFKLDVGIGISGVLITALSGWSMPEMRYNGTFNKEKGTIDIYKETRTLQNSSQGYPTNSLVPAVNFSNWAKEGQPYISDLLPLDPVIITDVNNLPLVETALGTSVGNKGNQFVVPAIFLKYKNTKDFEKTTSDNTVIALNSITIFVSGGTAIAADVALATRIWAIMEVVGAVGNIAETEGALDKYPQLKEALGYYNMAMAVIGVKNIGKGLVNFAKNLPEETKIALKTNLSLRNRITDLYLKWKVTTTNIEGLSEEGKQLVAKQEQVFKLLGAANEVSDLANELPSQLGGKLFSSVITKTGNGISKLVIQPLLRLEPAASRELRSLISKTVTNKITGLKSWLKIESTVYVSLHATENGTFILNDVEVSAEELGEWLSKTAKTDANNIVLLSCNDLESAKSLAKYTGKTVYSTDGALTLFPDGIKRAEGTNWYKISSEGTAEKMEGQLPVTECTQCDPEHGVEMGVEGTKSNEPGINWASVVDDVDNLLKPQVENLKKLYPDLQVGYRGSLATGTKFSTGGAFNPADWDVDAFIVSDDLSSAIDKINLKNGGLKAFRDGNKINSINKISDDLENSFKKMSGYRTEPGKPFTFRVWTKSEFDRIIKPNGYKLL